MFWLRKSYLGIIKIIWLHQFHYQNMIAFMRPAQHIFFLFSGCPGQLARMTTDLTAHWTSCKSSEHVRHHKDDRRAQENSNPDAKKGTSPYHSSPIPLFYLLLPWNCRNKMFLLVAAVYYRCSFTTAIFEFHPLNNLNYLLSFVPDSTIPSLYVSCMVFKLAQILSSYTRVPPISFNKSRR